MLKVIIFIILVTRGVYSNLNITIQTKSVIMGSFRFPTKVALPQVNMNARVLRDHFKRQMAASNETTTQALKYIARNTALPPRARIEAQLQLTTMPNYTRMTALKDRCVFSGHARGIIKDFRINRYQFRMKALNGDLPGVVKGSW